MRIRRGEIYFVELDPTVGNEIGGNKRRPVAVLSINDINNKGLVVSVVPGTSTKKSAHFKNVAVVQPSPRNGLLRETTFQCHQVRGIDQSRFKAPPIGHLDVSDLIAIEDAVRYSLGFGPRRA